MRKLQPIAPDIFLWTDTCNVYVVRDGDSALLIDLGDGSVLDHLREIGVTNVEWVLFTHHHREQCQGFPQLEAWKAQVAAPEAERAFFERPSDFRKVRVTLEDPFSVYGASFVRPPITPIPLDRTFKKMDDFSWHGHEIWCVDTRGHSPGGMSYLLRVGDRFWAFSGDVMCAGARLHNWFDSEWDYGFGAGIYALYGAAALLERFNPAMLLPSHGPLIRDPAGELAAFRDKLRDLTPLYLRGYDVNTFASGDQDNVSQPSDVPHVWQITQHLYKFKGPNFWPNFTILIDDEGRGLVIDCGLFEPAFLDKAIQGMHDRLGLKQIEAVFVTHAHGDHLLEAEHVRQTWGAELWTMRGVHERCESPQDYDFVAPIQSYGPSIERGIESVKFDRLIDPDSFFEWHGYTFSVDWMPGQTKYACCLHGEIDGRRVAFTGDNIFGSATSDRQNGHEAVVARNACILEEGYLYAAHYLHSIGPDLLIGGHSWVIDRPTELIERYREGALALREAFRGLSGEDDYRYMFDPFWAHAEPYRISIEPGGEAEVEIVVRNFLTRPQPHRIELRAPPGISAEPATLEFQLGPEATVRLPVKLSAMADTPASVGMIALDITRSGKRYGQLFDFIVIVGQPDAALPAAGKKDKAGY